MAKFLFFAVPAVIALILGWSLARWRLWAGWALCAGLLVLGLGRFVMWIRIPDGFGMAAYIGLLELGVGGSAALGAAIGTLIARRQGPWRR